MIGLPAARKDYVVCPNGVFYGIKKLWIGSKRQSVRVFYVVNIFVAIYAFGGSCEDKIKLLCGLDEVMNSICVVSGIFFVPKNSWDSIFVAVFQNRQKFSAVFIRKVFACIDAPFPRTF